MNRLYKSFFCIALSNILVLTAQSNAKAEVAHWQYTGFIDHIFDNELNLPISVGTPAFFDIQFDSLTPDSGMGPSGVYRISGPSARIDMKIGSFSSTPVDQFAIHVLPENCCAADDQVNFLAFSDSDVFIHVDFPGLVDDAEFIMFFRRKKDPIVSAALPFMPPNPKEYFDVLWGLRKGPVSNRTLSFNGRLVQYIPEPSSLLLAAGLMVFGGCQRLFGRGGIGSIHCAN